MTNFILRFELAKKKYDDVNIASLVFTIFGYRFQFLRFKKLLGQSKNESNHVPTRCHLLLDNNACRDNLNPLSIRKFARKQNKKIKRAIVKPTYFSLHPKRKSRCSLIIMLFLVPGYTMYINTRAKKTKAQLQFSLIMNHFHF